MRCVALRSIDFSDEEYKALKDNELANKLLKNQRKTPSRLDNRASLPKQEAGEWNILVEEQGSNL